MTDPGSRRRRLIGAIAAGLLLAAAAPAGAWTYVTVDRTAFDASARAAMMATAGRFNPYVDATWTFEGDSGAGTTELTAGGYYRPLPWLKVGAFYRFAQGARGDLDWLWSGGSWVWADVSGRFEHQVLLDATPRFLLPFLPGGNWVAALKVRYGYDFTNARQSLYLRPGLTAVILDGRDPRWNLSLNYGLGLALDYGWFPLYEHGPYVTILYHAGPALKIEGRVSYTRVSWRADRAGTDYRLDSHRWGISAGLIYTPEFR